ncbi:MAG: hypothetical protein INR71_07465, partial [Terriglobus roseus]|nr:hypothetical protein [Terriglobus roseus]
MMQATLPLAIVSIAAALTCTTASAQSSQPPVDTNPIDVRTGAQIEQQAHEFLEEAKKRPDGIVSKTLERYPGHFTML